jgi:cyclase
MPLTVGGGVRTVEDARALLLAGADKVAVNSAAVSRPEVVATSPRSSAASASSPRSMRGGEGRWEIFTHGGRKATGIDAVAHAVRWPNWARANCWSPRWTATARKAGYDLALTRAIADAVSVPVIASGGVGTLDHLVEGVTEGHASAVLAASIFHFGTYSIAEAHAALRAAGIARARLLGEEAIETIVAALSGSREELIGKLPTPCSTCWFCSTPKVWPGTRFWPNWNAVKAPVGLPKKPAGATNADRCHPAL